MTIPSRERLCCLQQDAKAVTRGLVSYKAASLARLLCPCLTTTVSFFLFAPSLSLGPLGQSQISTVVPPSVLAQQGGGNGGSPSYGSHSSLSRRASAAHQPGAIQDARRVSRRRSAASSFSGFEVVDSGHLPAGPAELGSIQFDNNNRCTLQRTKNPPRTPSTACAASRGVDPAFGEQRRDANRVRRCGSVNADRRPSCVDPDHTPSRQLG